MTEAVVRPELPGDRRAVREVNENAFARPEEARLVEALHSQNAVVVALIAEVGETIAGHILFSPAEVEFSGCGRRIVGLAPLAVLPRFQKQGIGGALIRDGLVRCRAAGADVVVVLGHPDYYPRFGFVEAGQYGLRCEYDVPPQAFMALALWPDALRGVSGLVRYHNAFAQV